MKVTRLVELSINYAIQDKLATKKTGENPQSADFITYNLKYTSIQTNYSIVVSVNGATVNSGYTVDYINGIITFNPALTSSDIVSVDYYYCPVNIYDEGKSPTDDDFRYPAIGIYTDGDDRYPIELGSTNKEILGNWIIGVMTERGGERNDISDSIMEVFDEVLPVIDYNQGFPVNRDGTLNTNFNKESQTVGYMVCQSINSTKGGSLDIGDKPKYLSDIMVELKINI